MKIITSTGKEFLCDFFVLNASELYAHLPGADLVEVAAVFGQPTETRALTWGTQTATGYTRLSSISIENDGVQINLSRY